MPEPVLTATPPNAPASDGRPDPIISIDRPAQYIDLSTVIGVILSFILIIVAVQIGDTGASFFDLPSVILVIFGTIVITCVSYTGRELRLAWPVIAGSTMREMHDPSKVANDVLDIALLARKRGLLSLNMHSNELRKNPFLYNAVQMVTDGFLADDVDRLLTQDIDMTLDGYRRAAGILRRASEIAPAMGLIGTLVGLVQMLASLNNPSGIGPAMAVALLTTFYGAIMGSVVLAPIAAKLERNANEDALIKTLIHTGMLSILRQENPRKLEMELNSLLPPDQRVRYFEV